MKWVRSKDGVIFGVCKGLARTLDIPLGWFRLLWVFSLLFFGVGLGVYLMLAITLPREDKALQALDPWILGVCSRISIRTELDVGIVRFLAVSLSLLSLGATLVGYIVLHFILDRPANHNSDNKPATPPATT
jgi:phage shock protein PspC (stress-responsive transcriptional regulator)